MDASHAICLWCCKLYGSSVLYIYLCSSRFCSGILGQFLVIMDLTTYRGLNYISLVSVSLSTLVSFCLPKVQTSLYFHRTSSIDNEIREPRNWKMTLKHFKGDVVAAFGNPYILKWSIWWSIGMAGNFQVGNYIQPLWECIAPNGSNEIYNGGVEAFTTFLGALFAFLLGYVKLNWSVYGECVILFCSVLNGLLLIMMGHTDHIWIAYAGYCAFRSLYQMMITIASFEVARNINKDSYGLVFGINTFFALLWQTILTIIVVDDIGFTLPLRKQFYVYGGFWMFCGIAFRISSFIAYLRSYGSSKEEYHPYGQTVPTTSQLLKRHQGQLKLRTSHRLNLHKYSESCQILRCDYFRS
ncbi:SLC19A2_3 [Lepeophtheirus salmonis]|uniref:SLC19A2_3 n=1 Tax=Lepeophtheirus salmonis TaxID=72036 RepID=A0A7R8H1D7_LEPSM|nr:SLC19A2_3 [Lepeophtheirus salmonis]CAF2805483.1 SLC19A2_3 [Lepeophtheirus salmonis]